jgi:uncharacterized protein (UPF0335 family)
MTSNSDTALKGYVDRIERLEAEKAELAGDIKDIYQEVKSNGFEVKLVRRLIRERKQDAAKRQEEEAILDTYRSALGMLADTPLGNAAIMAASR